jgi:hypothetical protein
MLYLSIMDVSIAVYIISFNICVNVLEYCLMIKTVSKINKFQGGNL